MIKYEVSFPADKKTKLEEFVRFVLNDLHIENEPNILFQDGKKQLKTTAQYQYRRNGDTVGCSVVVNAKDRALVDVMRSVAHELRHHYQNQNKQLQGKPSDIGGNIEDDANAYAGQMIKRFAQEQPENALIYEQQEEQGEEDVDLGKLFRTIDKRIEQVIEYWKNEGNVNFNELFMFTYKDMTAYEESNKYFNEKFSNRLADALLNGELPCEIKSQMYPEDVEDLIRTNECWKNMVETFMFHEGVEKILEYYEPCVLWDGWLFRLINKENLDKIKAATKEEVITADYLEEEYPDLCHRLCWSYTNAQESADIDYFYKQVEKAVGEIFSPFGGYTVKELRKHKIFEFNNTFTAYKKSKTFRGYLMIIIKEYLNDSILEYDCEMTSTTELLELTLGELKSDDENKDVYDDLLGGRPYINCNVTQYGSVGKVDVNELNEYYFSDAIEQFFNAENMSESVENNRIIYKETKGKAAFKLGLVKELGDIVGKNDDITLIIYANEPVGYYYQDDEGVLHALEIKPAYQRKGIGKKVLYDISFNGVVKFFNLLPSGLALMKSAGEVKIDQHGFGKLFLKNEI